MGVRKFRSVFMHYVLLIAFGVMFILAVNIGAYLLAVNTGVILPLTKAQEEIDIASDKLQSSSKINIEDIPEFCEYAFFTDSGIFGTGSVDKKTANGWWKNCIDNQKTSTSSHKYVVINKKDKILIMQYRTTAQFENEALRMIFPAADILFICAILIQIFIFLFALSFAFGKYISRKIDTLLVAVQRIEQQDLDFEMSKSNIFEIDKVSVALDHMKTALKQSLSKQWKDERIRQNQLSALAHDLKTPLTIVRGNTELLLDTELTEEQQECANYIETSAMHMQNYVQALIEATKTWDSYQLQMQDISINTLLQEVEKQINGLCSINNITLHWNNTLHDFYYTLDYHLFVRSLVNILSNAVEHTPQGGTISLNAEKENGKLKFIVCDTGTGFTQEALKHGTEQFFMDDNSRSSKSHYGMGLYIANTIIKLHGGQLILENSAETGGAKVIVQLPLQENS